MGAKWKGHYRTTQSGCQNAALRVANRNVPRLLYNGAMKRGILALGCLLVAGLAADDRPGQDPDLIPPDAPRDEVILRRMEILRRIGEENKRHADQTAELKRQFELAIAAARKEPSRPNLDRMAGLAGPVLDAREEAIGLLVGLLDDKTAPVRTDAAILLSSVFHERRAALPLKRLLETEKDPETLQRILRALPGILASSSPDQASRESTAAFWREARSAAELAWVFAEPAPLPARPQRDPPKPPAFAPDPALERLVADLGAEDLQDREEAQKRILALGAKEPARILALLPAGSDDTEVAERLAAIRARIPWDAAREKSLAAFPDDAAMRDRIQRAYDRPGHGAGLLLAQTASQERPPDRLEEAIFPLLEIPEPAAVAYAVQALGTLKPPPPQDRILPLLDHPDARVRVSAVRTLLRSGANGLADEILPLLADPDESVRLEALRAVASEESVALAPRLAALLSDPSERVAADAGELLWRIWARAAFAQPLGRLLEGPHLTLSIAAGRCLQALRLPLGGRLPAREWWARHRDDPDLREPRGPDVPPAREAEPKR